MTDEFIVAGAGNGGLASALALARAGRQVRVLEQGVDISEIGAGLQLGPNADCVLKKLNIDKDIDRWAGFPTQVRIMDGLSGKRLNRVDLGAEFVARFGAPYRVIHRGDLLRVLLNACRANDNITIETSARVQGFRDTGKVVEIQSRAGERTGCALIGADGARSTIRSKLLADGPPDSAGHIIARAMIPAGDMPLQDNAVVLWLIPGGHVVHYPVRGKDVYNLVVAWSGIWEEEGWNAPASREEVEAVGFGTTSQLRQILKAASSWRKWAAVDKDPSDVWGKGRVTLLGDAAHPVLPYLAQGAVMALEDAVVLTRELDKHDDIPSALRAYESARQPRLEQMCKICRKAGLAYHAGGGFRAIRNLILRAMSEKASRNRLAWIYDWRL